LIFPENIDIMVVVVAVVAIARDIISTHTKLLAD
jgi:hypothetical protein